MKDAFGRSDLGRCEEKEELGLKESKVDGRWELTVGGLTSTTMSVKKSPPYVVNYSPHHFRHQRLGILFAHQAHTLDVGHAMGFYDFDCSYSALPMGLN